jgi:hypothetical protein
MPRPTGKSPPGAALPPVGCPAPADSQYRFQRTPVTAPARAGRTVVLVPDVPIAVRKSRNRAATPRIVRGGPSSVKGTREILSNRSAERIFGAHP